MGIIEKIVVSDETLAQLREEARRHGRTLEQEAAERIEGRRSEPSRDDLIARMRAFRESLPPQKTDSLSLLRADRDR